MSRALPHDAQGVIVTGGSRGIGRACALLFARRGADVTIQFHTARAEAESLVSEIHQMGRRAWAVQGDAASREDAKHLVRQAEEAMGSIHVVVANAGIDGSGPIDSTSAVSFRRTLETDLYGPFALVQAAAVPLSATGGSAILLASISGLMSDPSSIDYTAAKAGVIAMTRSLAVALAPRVRVNAVAPGSVRTPMNQVAWEDPKERETIRRTIPLGRWGTPEEIAEAVTFLSEEGARFITGVTLVVDGGQSHFWTMGTREGPPPPPDVQA